MNQFLEKKNINWGIIGCGDVTEKKSGPAFNKVEHSKLIAVMRRNSEKVKDYATRHGVPKYYTCAQALIDDKDIDAVYIATPPDTHCEYALKVAEAGKACCVEKPMALDYAQCQTMIEAFKTAQVPLFVAYYRRSLPRFIQVKHWLDEGLIGDVRHVDWRYHSPAKEGDLDKNNWRVKPNIAGGGYFVDLASHGFDLLLYLLGSVNNVSGFSLNQQKRYPAEDAVVASFLFESGATGSGAWNFGSYSFCDEVSILGTDGEIRFSVFAEQAVSIQSANLTESKTIAHPENVQFYHIDNMVKHLRGKCTHPSLGSSAAVTSKILEEILEGEKS